MINYPWVSYYRNADELNSTIEHIYVPILSDVVFEGKVVPPPTQIAWYVNVFIIIHSLMNSII